MYDTTKPYKKEISEIIKRTWNNFNFYSDNGFFTLNRENVKIVGHVDGIGTKGIYHWNKRTFKSAVSDAMAMNLNDLAMSRAIPFAIIDHLFVPKDDQEAILEIINELSKQCALKDISIIGGETAIHDNMEGMELSISMLGYASRKIENKFKKDDILIGLASNGLHSNGFTKIRQLFGEEYREDFTIPTEIYLEKILGLNKNYTINGMMHITGGAFTKLKDLLENCDAEIEPLQPQEIFKEIYSKGLSDEEMYKTFNCGTGFIFSVPESQSEKCLEEITEFKAERIGKIIQGSGKIKIKSAFSDKIVEY